MHPTICTIGPFTIYSYGLALAVAFLISSSLALKEARSQNFPADIIFNLLSLVLVSGIIGARLFYCLSNAAYFFKHPLEIIMLQRGGLSWFGGLISGALFAILYIRRRKLPLLKTLDLIAPFVALAQAIGRLGCLLNGCCYGRESALGIYFPVHEAVLIPTQLYSAFLLVVIFIALRLLQDRPHRPGNIFFIYLLLYSLKRFFIEFWRADSPVFFLGLTFFQLLSCAIFAAAFFTLILRKKN